MRTAVPMTGKKAIEQGSRQSFAEQLRNGQGANQDQEQQTVGMARALSGTGGGVGEEALTSQPKDEDSDWIVRLSEDGFTVVSLFGSPPPSSHWEALLVNAPGKDFDNFLD